MNGEVAVASIDKYDDVNVFVGLDVGKSEHHTVALDKNGRRPFDKALPDDEARLRTILAQLAEHGVVLPVAVAHAAGALVDYLPGLAMRRSLPRLPARCRTRSGPSRSLTRTSQS